MELFGTDYLISTYFWTTLAFVILLAFMWKFAVPAITNMLDARIIKVKTDIEAAEKDRARAEKTLDSYHRQLEKAKAEAQDIIAIARDEASALVAARTQELEADLQIKAEAARKSIDMAKQSALLSVEKEVANLSIEVARKLLNEKVDSKKANKLADDAIQELIN